MKPEKVVIIGAVAAGAKAAAKLKRLCPECTIEVFTQDEYISYSACGMPYFIKGTFDDVNRLFARSVEDFEAQGINIHLLHKCIKKWVEVSQATTSWKGVSLAKLENQLN